MQVALGAGARLRRVVTTPDVLLPAYDLSKYLDPCHLRSLHIELGRELNCLEQLATAAPNLVSLCVDFEASGSHGLKMALNALLSSLSPLPLEFLFLRWRRPWTGRSAYRKSMETMQNDFPSLIPRSLASLRSVGFRTSEMEGKWHKVFDIDEGASRLAVTSAHEWADTLAHYERGWMTSSL